MTSGEEEYKRGLDPSVGIRLRKGDSIFSAEGDLLKGLKQACNKSLGKSYRKPCFLLNSEPFRYLAERFNPCHGNLCDKTLPLLTTRFPKPFRQDFFAVWDEIYKNFKAFSCLIILKWQESMRLNA
ncbi:hypothetical protein AVEN_207966-1 [Araneus ventricosus]|uniref:Uncharacterized protein n=1 Tax=Araneus ventricosus TaxID=182803 RepID=A0A4Y2MJV5_ARAVE|nr:hypothetical protein AVEN_207966-1 [Araneus ventricosus]